MRRTSVGTRTWQQIDTDTQHIKQLASHADRREGLFKEHSSCGLIIRCNSRGKRLPYPNYFSIENTET